MKHLTMMSFVLSVAVGVAIPGASRCHATDPPPSRGRAVVNPQAAAAAGIRRIESNRVVLYTDLAPSPAVDSLPAIADQAFPQWCEYFNIDPAAHPAWRVTGFLMKDPDRFRRLGLLPSHLPRFKNGYSYDYDFWLYEQQSAYYRCHLLLHEITHCFMTTTLRGIAQPWYLEGTAELFGTHQWKDDRLTMRWNPPSKESADNWGRVGMIQEQSERGHMKTVDDILAYSPTAHLTDEAYAWCWALSYLLDHDPRFRDRFRQVYRDVGKPTLTSNFRRAMGNDWHLLSVQWLVLAGEIDYGYDVQRTMLDLSLGRELAGTGPAAAKIVTIAADRGWQNTGIRLKAGETYRIRAAGRYQVASEPRRWISEPGGVTIRYYRGRPLGILLAAVVPDHAAGPEKIAQAILQPTTVGLYRMVTPPVDGTLLLKINDSPGQLHDNAGTLRAEITAP